MRLGIFLPNWIGDAVMATPTLRAVRGLVGAQGRLVGVMRPPVAEVLAGVPWFDEQILYAPGSDDPALRGWSLVRTLRRQRLDAVVLLTNSLRTGLLAWLSGARQRIGYVRYGRGPLLTHKLYAPREGGQWTPTSALDLYLETAYALGCPEQPRRVQLATTPADEQAADLAWRRLKLPEPERVVVLNSGGAYGSAKHWPVGYFAALARRIATQLDRGVLVLCGPKERRQARQIVESAGHPRVVSLAEQPLSLGLSKACVRRARLMVATDSGPRHFAAGFDVPVVTLFGPTHIAWSENYHPRAVHLQREVPCGPCQKRVCPLEHHRCMRDLSVDEVFRAARFLLGETETRRDAAA